MGGTIGLQLVVLIFLIIYEIQGRHHHGKKTDNDNPSPTAAATGECDVFKGKWVYHDSKHYPLYTSKECPFIEKVFNCQNNGRPDSLYLNYKWQPSACNLPRFKGKDFLRRFKGKRIMFVGDSLSLNQWQSLTCLLHASVPRSNYTLTRTRVLSIFRLPEYNVTVMLSRNAFLVDIVNEEKVGRALKLDSISSGKQWSGIDTLIFDTWHWWLHTGQKQPWDIIEEANATYKDMDRMVAFEKGLSTWASWVDSHVHPSRTKVFFQGVSPDHAHASEWGGRYEKDCKGEQEPVVGGRYRGGPHPAEAVVERVVSKMKTPIYLLNITAMSQLRKDGHPSVFGFGARQRRRVISRSVSDCSHWCLPGVPDTWNQLLYTLVIRSSSF